MNIFLYNSINKGGYMAYRQQSIKTNMIMSIINTSANFIFPLITYSYVTRILSTEGIGKVAFVQSVLTYFSYIASLGISSYGIRECAKVRDRQDALSKLVHELILINLISTFVAYFLLFFSVLLVPKFQNYKLLFLVMGSSIILQTMGVEWLYNALEQYTYITIRSLFFKTVSVFLTFLLIKNVNDYVIYGGITIFTQGASNILNFLNAKKYINTKKYSNYEIKKHINPILIFFTSAIIITVYSQFDTLMLGFIKGDSEVGIYNAALKIKSLIISISYGITSVLIPRMTVYYNNERNKYNNLLKKSLEISLVFVVPFVVYIFINTSDVLLFLCGHEFLSAFQTLRILIICVLPLVLTNLFGNQVLIPKGNEKRYTTSVIIGLFINLVLNFLLIPQYGSAGAAFATLMTEVSNTIIMSSDCKSEITYLIKNIKVYKYIISILLSLFVELICVYFIGLLSIFMRLVISSIVFFGTYYISLLILKNDILLSSLRWINLSIKLFRKRC